MHGEYLLYVCVPYTVLCTCMYVYSAVHILIHTLLRTNAYTLLSYMYTCPVIYLLLYTPFTSYLYIPIMHPYYIHTPYTYAPIYRSQGGAEPAQVRGGGGGGVRRVGHHLRDLRERGRWVCSVYCVCVSVVYMCVYVCMCVCMYVCMYVYVLCIRAYAVSYYNTYDCMYVLYIIAHLYLL